MDTINSSEILNKASTNNLSKKDQILKYYQDNFNLDLTKFNNAELKEIIPIINNKITEMYEAELRKYTNFSLILDDITTQLQTLIDDYNN